jgi:hypothetical protein
VEDTVAADMAAADMAAVDMEAAALARVTLAEVTMDMEDIAMVLAMAIEGIISVAAITAMALAARTTRHTDGHTPAPTEW